MNWIDIVWPVMGGVSLTLGLIHVLIWFRQRHQPALLMFGLAAVSVTVLGIFELMLMRAQSAHQYAQTLSWAHVPVTLLVIALVGFVLLHFRAGRTWLGLSACALRVVSLVPGVVWGGNLRFRHITGLEHVDLWGGASMAVPVGEPSLWMLVAVAADVLLLLFLADAIVSVRKRTNHPSERRRVALVCGSMIAFVILASGWATLVGTGIVNGPLAINIPFIGVLVVMSYEIGGSVVRATTLERKLEESESNLRLTADAVGLGLWTWDIEGREAWLSEAGSAILGFGTRGRIDTELFLERVHVEDRDAIRQARDEAVQKTGRFECEYRLPQPDGSMRWISAIGRVEEARGAVPRSIRGVALDITERRRAEERFRLVVESSPTAMLMIDADGLITLANAQAARVFGYSVTELLSSKIDALVPALARVAREHDQTDFATHAKSRASGAGRLGRRKDGTDVPIDIALNPTHIADRRFLLASITDVSERLRTERELAEQRDELAHLSRISVLGEMSGSLAHELNQPLTAILSNAQAALRYLDRVDPDLPEVHESLVRIVENDKRAGEVIRRLRAMLRKEKTEYMDLHVNEVVHDVLRLMSNDLLNRRTSVVLDLAPRLPPVSGDPVQLQQVLLNLVINAGDAMRLVDGDRVLTLRTALAQDDFVEVSVSDVGPGVGAADIERIFDPFVTSKPEGMGLGLAVCKTIVQAHLGSIRASNNPAGGATVHVLLPPSAGGGMQSTTS